MEKFDGSIFLVDDYFYENDKVFYLLLFKLMVKYYFYKA